MPSQNRGGDHLDHLRLSWGEIVNPAAWRCLAEDLPLTLELLRNPIPRALLNYQLSIAVARGEFDLCAEATQLSVRRRHQILITDQRFRSRMALKRALYSSDAKQIVLGGSRDECVGICLSEGLRSMPLPEGKLRSPAAALLRIERRGHD